MNAIQKQAKALQASEFKKEIADVYAAIFAVQEQLRAMKMNVINASIKRTDC